MLNQPTLCTISITFSHPALLRICLTLVMLVCLCPVVADGKHSYMDLSAECYSNHVMRPPVNSQRWTFAAHTHSHVTVSCHASL